MADTRRPALPARPWTHGEILVAGAGVLLAADIVLLPWHHYAIDTSALAKLGVKVPSFTRNVNGLHNPQAFFGVGALIVTVGLVLLVLAHKLSPAIPRLEQVHVVAGPLVLGLVLAKLLANHDFLGLGAWVGVVLAAALAYGGFLLGQETEEGSGGSARRHP